MPTTTHSDDTNTHKTTDKTSKKDGRGRREGGREGREGKGITNRQRYDYVCRTMCWEILSTIAPL